jgi:hypothetical protein
VEEGGREQAELQSFLGFSLNFNQLVKNAKSGQMRSGKRISVRNHRNQ